MTLVEFNEGLNKIDFKQGTNIQKLDDYLLACVKQLMIYKHKEPTYELFLLIFEQARSGPKIEFDESWKELYSSEDDWMDPEFNNLSEWENLKHELCSLATDLIQTREIRNQPGYDKKEYLYEWDSEGGVRFYNGTTPEAILTYGATRFEGEYPATAFKVSKVTWKEFSYPIWIGISYE